MLKKLLDKFGPDPTNLTEKEQMRLALINMRVRDEDGDVHFIDLPPSQIAGNESSSANNAEEGASGAGEVGRLAIGSVGAALHYENLTSARITHIVCLCTQVRSMFPDSFEYFRVDDFDDDGSPESVVVFRRQIGRCLEFIAESIAAGGSVLVHCFQGKSRSAAFCCAYVLHQYPESQVPTPLSALQLIRQSRPQASPNFALMSLLHTIERHRGSSHSSTATEVDISETVFKIT